MTYLAPLPTKLKVGYIDYRILAWEHVDATACGRYGETAHLSKIIRIDAYFGPRQTAETLLHEIMHACYHVWSIKDEEDEENTVSKLSAALATVFRDNPSVASFIVQSLLIDDQAAA